MSVPGILYAWRPHVVHAVLLLLIGGAGFAVGQQRPPAGAPPARRVIQPAGYKPSPAPLVPAILVGDTLYLSGSTGGDPTTGQLVAGGLDAEMRQIVGNLRTVLAAADMTFADVVTVTAYLADMADYARFNELYREVFPQWRLSGAVDGGGSRSGARRPPRADHDGRAQQVAGLTRRTCHDPPRRRARVARLGRCPRLGPGHQSAVAGRQGEELPAAHDLARGARPADPHRHGHHAGRLARGARPPGADRHRLPERPRARQAGGAEDRCAGGADPFPRKLARTTWRSRARSRCRPRRFSSSTSRPRRA